METLEYACGEGLVARASLRGLDAEKARCCGLCRCGWGQTSVTVSTWVSYCWSSLLSVEVSL